jgi:hypothetical protein
MRAGKTLAVLVLVGLGLMAGCADDDTTTDGIACTAEARSSVTVTVVDGNGDPVTDATVTYTVDGGDPQQAEPFPDGTFVAGWELAGTFTVTAQKDGFLPAQETVTVAMDEVGCHVVSQTVQLVLLPAM